MAESGHEEPGRYRCPNCNRVLTIFVSPVEAPFCSKCAQPMLRETSATYTDIRPPCLQTQLAEQEYMMYRVGIQY